jgi:hypothetical protein
MTDQDKQDKAAPGRPVRRRSYESPSLVRRTKLARLTGTDTVTSVPTSFR